MATASEFLDSVTTALENADPVPPAIGSAVGLVLLLSALRLRGARGSAPLRSILGLFLAGAAAFASMVAALYGGGLSWAIPPRGFLDWAIVASAAGALAAVLVGWSTRWRWVGVAATAVLLGYLFAVPTESLHDRYWNGRVAVHVVGLGGAGVLAVLIRLAQGAQGSTAEGMLAFAISAAMAAPAVGLTGTGVSAGLAGALAGGAGIFGAFLLLFPKMRVGAQAIGHSAGVAQAMALTGVLANGVLYANTPKWAGAVILLAPCLTLLPGKSKGMSFLRLGLVALACVVPVAVILHGQGPANPYGY